MSGYFGPMLGSWQFDSSMKKSKWCWSIWWNRSLSDRCIVLCTSAIYVIHHLIHYLLSSPVCCSHHPSKHDCRLGYPHLIKMHLSKFWIIQFWISFTTWYCNCYLDVIFIQDVSVCLLFIFLFSNYYLSLFSVWINDRLLRYFLLHLFSSFCGSCPQKEYQLSIIQSDDTDLPLSVLSSPVVLISDQEAWF